MTIWWYDAMGCDESDTQCYHRWRDIHIAAIVPSYVSLCCSLYIIVMTFFYIHHFRKITFGATLPVFISICDAIFHSCHGTDHLHNLITGKLPPYGLCLFLGSMKPFAINGQTTWVLATAVFINYCIRYDRPPQKDFNLFNYFMHGVCWGIPCIILIFGLSFNVYGQEVSGPWCGIKKPQNDLLMVDMWVLSTDLILIVLYSWTGYYFYNKTKQHDDAENEMASSSPNSHKTKKILSILPWFPIVYVAQWSVYLSWKLFLNRTWIETMLTVTITNMGGMFNVIVFYRLLMYPINKEKKKAKLKALQMSHSNQIQLRKKKKKLKLEIDDLDRYQLMQDDANSNL